MEQVFNPCEEVLSAYLFGSMAEGVMSQRSDVDFAVRLRSGLRAEQKHGIRARLEETLENMFMRQADVVILNDASLKMIHQVLKSGKLVYTKNLRDEETFRLQKQKEYFDFQYYMEKERRDLRAFYGC